jgi:pimeloyl-ACP methyl ester carboxylesterase
VKRIIPAALAMGLLWTAHGQDVTGLWLGSLTASGLTLRLALHVSRSEKGLAATLDSLDQGANGIPVSAVTLDGRKLKLEIAMIHGTYEGTVGEDNATISGTWKQTIPVPLVFKRTDKLPDLSRPQEPKKPYPYDEQEVSYENKAAQIKFAGTLTLPRSGAPHPAVLLITGSGPQDRNETLMGHKPFLVLADYLTRRGIAVLRVDDRGVGGSGGKIDEGTTEDFAGDAVAGVECLKSRKEIDPRRIGLIGHSEGGVIAPLAATRSSDVAFVVMMAGTGVAGDKVIATQSYAVPKAMGADEEGASMNRNIAMLMVDAALSETDPVAAEHRFQERLATLTANWTEAQRSALKAMQSQLQTQMKQLTSRWFRTFLTLDPKPILMKVKAPVLAINGELDTQVVPKQNLPAIVEALEAGGNPDYTVVKLPKLNHLFQTARTGSLAEYSQIEETMSPVALQLMADWIARHTAR